jgi:PAS domain S-box-containing protein
VRLRGAPPVFSFGRDRFRVCARLALVALCCATPTWALTPNRNIDQYGHDAWTSQNGLPGEAVYEILQTPDGYLWLRTSTGLVRFDGARFVLVEPVVAKKPVHEPVKAICRSADGNLLIRTTSRTILYKDGAFSDYLPPAPLPDGGIRTLFESQEHEVFIGSDDFIYVIRNGQIEMLRRGTAWVNAFFEDEKGLLWIGASTGLYTYRNGVLSVPGNLDAQGATNVVVGDREHNVWVGTVSSGLYRMNQARSALTPVARDAIHSQVFAILEDRRENLWVGTNSGMFRLTGGRISLFNSLSGLTDSRVLSLYEDREGSIWVGTSSGLDRFRDTSVTAFTSKEGLPSDEIKSALETRDGSLYVFCNGGGLGSIKNGVVTAIPKQKGVPDFYGSALFESRDGSLWIGPVGGLTRYKDGNFTVYSSDARLSKHFISAIAEDDESLIVTTSETVALRFKDGKVTPFTFEGQMTPLSKPGNYTFTIYRDPAGTLWFGTVQGLFKFARGEPPANAFQKQINFPVTSISDDRRGSLWLGGRIPGLTRLRISDGRVTHYTKQSGLFDDYPSRALSDNDGNLWISTPNGIYMAKRKELDDYADGLGSPIRPAVYGIADGMKTSEASSPASQPGGWRTHDGTLWFATQKGVVAIDPKHLMLNDLLPPVVIESVVADGDTLATGKALEVPPGKDRIEFHYTGLSLLVPERVRFKYRLEGYDRDWVDAGSRRVAYYTNLPPGGYHFRVIASNNDGVWNLEGATIGLVLKPHFYQTVWFYTVCVLTALLCAMTGQRLYTRRLWVRTKELAHMVDERTRNLQEEIQERRRVEAAVEEQRAFLRQVIDSSSSHIFVKDRDGRFVLINQALAEVFGTSVEQAQGKTDLEVSPHLEAATAFRRDDLEVMDTKREKRIPEERITDFQGRRIWVQTVKRPLADPDGSVNHVIGVATDITERKQMEANLRDSEELYRLLTENSYDLISLRDRDGRSIYLNPAFIRTLGAINVNSLSFERVHPDDAETIRQARKNILAGVAEHVTFRMRNANDTWRWMESKAVLVQHKGDTHVLSVMRDITERKRIEDELRFSEAEARERAAELTAVLDAVPALVFLSRSGPYQRMTSDRATRELLRLPSGVSTSESTPETNSPLSFHIVRDGRQVPSEELPLQQAVTTGLAVRGCELELEFEDGSTRSIYGNAIPLLDATGTVEGAVGAFVDITERKLAEEALRDSQQFLQAIIDNSSAVIYAKDLEGRYLLVNKSFEGLFSEAGTFIVGKTDYDLFPKEQAEAIHTADLRALTTDGLVKTEDILSVDGYLHVFISVKSPLRNKTGKPFAVCGVSTDVTELKQLEDQLRQAQKMEAIGQFAGRIAHDFNGVLTANLGYSELMMRRLDVQDQLYKMAKNIRDSSLRGRELTKRLLTFSRKQVLDLRPLHLNAAVSGLVEILELLMGKGIKFVRDLDPHLHAVKADPNEVEQVIINLVSNASQAMPESGTLTLSTSNVELKENFFRHNEAPNPGAWVLLEVSDTGCGMDSQTMAHIFEPFFTTKGPNKGTGLGLAMVYGFVRQCGGLIRVDSQVGKGTKVRVYLPSTTERVRAGQQPAQLPEELRGTETILIVDDEGMVRQLLYESLAELGYTILDARDGFDALQIAENYTKQIDLLLTDLVMPVMNGRALAQRFTLMHPESKVLFVSGYPGESCEIDVEPNSRYAFLAKPFAFDILVRKVRALLNGALLARQKATA